MTHPMGRFWSKKINETFRISYWHLVEQIKHSEVELGPFEKNTFFPPDPLKEHAVFR